MAVSNLIRMSKKAMIKVNRQIIWLVFLLSPSWVFPMDDFALFDNYPLEEAVSKEIKKVRTDITTQDLKNVVSLRAGWSWIYSLNGIGTLPNLTHLILSSNQLKDISPLAELIQLKKIDLWGNPIQDISPLAKLTNLEYLVLGSTNLKSVEHISDLTALKRLYLWDNQISDISPSLCA